MALDPSIILSGRRPQLPTAEDVVRLNQLGQQTEISNLALSKARQQQQDEATLADIYRGNTTPEGGINYEGVQQQMAARGLGAQIPGFQKERAAIESALKEQGIKDLDAFKKRNDIVNGAMGSLLSLAPEELTHDRVIGTISGLVDEGVITNDQGAQMVRQLPGPGQLRSFLVTKASEGLEASKRLEMIMPKPERIDSGGEIRTGTIDPRTGAFTQSGAIEKTQTPGERATATYRATTAANAAASSFTEDESNLMASLAEHGVNLPAGMRSRAQMKATFAGLLARNPTLMPDEIAEKIATGQINLAAERKESQTAATLAGRIAVAQNEVNEFIPLAREAARRVPRGQFLPFNKLRQMTDEQLSDPNIAQFKAYMTTLSNAYDQLAARGGTDMEKRAHNRKLFDTATSPEALEAVFQALENEAKAAEAAALKASRRRVETHEGATPGTPSAGGDVNVSRW